MDYCTKTLLEKHNCNSCMCLITLNSNSSSYIFCWCVHEEASATLSDMGNVKLEVHVYIMHV